jgi:DNA modification methylase
LIERTAIYSDKEVFKAAYSTEWDFHDEDTQEYLHSLHPYPARFIPQIPRKAILTWSQIGDVVLDPFCGCGTTLLEGLVHDRSVIGVDNNAVACLVSQAKTARYTEGDIEQLNELAQAIQKLLVPEGTTDCLVPEYENIHYWFDENAIKDLGMIRWNIEHYTSGNAKIMALAVLSAIIVRHSYQDSDTRYARVTKEYTPKSAISSYLSKLQGTIKKILEFIPTLKYKFNPQIFLRDSRDLGFINNESVNLIVTSPPYLNAYDYHKYHRHRLYWIGGDVSLARDNEIGKHDVFTRKGATPDRYFEDMKQCFEEWKRVLVKGGRALIVIGDSIVNKQPVPVADQFIQICEHIGLELEKRWIRTLKTSRKSFNQGARMDQEHLLLFIKS